MTVADPPRKLTEVFNIVELFGFNYEVVVSESVEFRKSRGHLLIQVCR